MNIKDFKNKKVTIIGLGLHGGGVGVAKFFSGLGAKVLVTDLRSKEELHESIEQLEGIEIKYVLGQHRPEDFTNTDLVIKNPAVPDNSRYLKIAKESKVPIETDIGIFFELCPAPIIGITGTKGKSTTSSLISELLRKKYKDVVLAGNIRASVLRKIKKINKQTKVVLELSSWQLNGLKSHKKSPKYAVITNIMRDHLNRYKGMEEYIDDKKQIFKSQTSKGYLVLNYNDNVVRDFANQAKSQVFFYSQDNGIVLDSNNHLGAFVKEGKIYFGGLDDKEEICSFDQIKLKGSHNIDNILAAITIAKIYDVSNKSIVKVLSKFKGLEGRLELINTIDGVRYVNDTTATTPDACMAALNSFGPRDIVLIAGGADKELVFDQLAEVIVNKVKALILLDGTATPKLQKAIKGQLESTGKELKIIGPMDNMRQAVATAQEEANEKDIVLLSPGCASFGLFRHEFERGDKFDRAVASLNK